jgi:hypothetical protein
MITGLDQLIDVSILNVDRCEQWKAVLSTYRELIVVLHKKEDFTDEEIKSFQCMANLFFSTWVKLRGREGVTNYIHMLGSGHISFYLHRYRNLYRYSQQGWEALNSKVKSFYFCRTQHSGHT